MRTVVRKVTRRGPEGAGVRTASRGGMGFPYMSGSANAAYSLAYQTALTESGRDSGLLHLTMRRL